MNRSWYAITEAEHKAERFNEAVEVRLVELIEDFDVRCTCGMPLAFDREVANNNMTIIVEPCPACIPVKEAP